jgi:hypothetical protein
MSFDLVAWLIVAFWIGFRAVLAFVPPTVALWMGAIVSVAGLVLPGVAHVMVAVLAPLGFVLPALAIRDLLGSTWIKVAPFHALEVTFVLIASTLFIAASIGVFPVDPYRLGYSAYVPGIAVLVGILWSFWRRHFFIAAALLTAQVAWSFGFLSPNFFDLTLHALIVPVCAVWLLKWMAARAFGQTRKIGHPVS